MSPDGIRLPSMLCPPLPEFRMPAEDRPSTLSLPISHDPMEPDPLSVCGSSAHRGTGSGIPAPSVLSTRLQSHSVLMISTASVRTAPRIFSLRYFARKATCPRHLPSVCANSRCPFGRAFLRFGFVPASQICDAPKEAFSSRFCAAAYSILPRIAGGRRIQRLFHMFTVYHTGAKRNKCSYCFDTVCPAFLPPYSRQKSRECGGRFFKVCRQMRKRREGDIPFPSPLPLMRSQR